MRELKIGGKHRSYDMFLEDVEIEGEMVPRFTEID
jgi:hypothetical protein